MQVGFALGRMEDDTAWSQAVKAEATRLWARFFSPGNASHLHISIPEEWANFFTIQLLKNDTFQNSKQLLSTKLPSLLATNESGLIDFSIPNTCPDNNFGCLTVLEEENESPGMGTSKVVPPKKRTYKRTTAIVETEVRRSSRLKVSSLGFKLKICSDKKCLACGTRPPTLKKNIIKKTCCRVLQTR